MGFVDMGRLPAHHTASPDQRCPGKDLERLRHSLRHSLAEAPYPHTSHLGVGSLGHRPGNLLEGPRLTEGPAQRADVLAKEVVDGSYVLLSYAFELAFDVWRLVDCWIFCNGRAWGGRPTQMARSRRRIPNFGRRLEGQNFLDYRR